MYDQEVLAKLQATWPETTDYLTKLGQLNNDLMALREMQAADEHIPSWLEQEEWPKRAQLGEAQTHLAALLSQLEQETKGPSVPEHTTHEATTAPNTERSPRFKM
ncbi:hypothetical protein [Leucobacter aridicollis]|uniref:hypothetical protein n=1 Tax=Leucobacter aridicollis TaxID=283878 RepID=UPI002168B6AA|nr:hypothetical protein [Leucobacter aridicollis]MCS3427594.1 hypothetical protein [Leucobacter aridicollis]